MTWPFCCPCMRANTATLLMTVCTTAPSACCSICSKADPVTQHCALPCSNSEVLHGIIDCMYVRMYVLGTNSGPTHKALIMQIDLKQFKILLLTGKACKHWNMAAVTLQSSLRLDMAKAVDGGEDHGCSHCPSLLCMLHCIKNVVYSCCPLS